MGFAHRVYALPGEAFDLDIAINAMPGIVMAAGKLCGAQRKRTRALVENGADEIGLVVNLKGRYLITQRGEELVLRDGEAAFLSCSDPYSSTQETAGDVLALRFPVRGSLLSSTAWVTAACGEYRATSRRLVS